MKGLLYCAGMLSLAATSSLLNASSSPSTNVSIRLASGPVTGSSSNGVSSYLGLPYAAPPTGPNRWRSPQPAPRWTEPLAATQFGPSCPQTMFGSLGPWTHEYMPQGATSEDCLTLNVWTPAKARRDLPVLVWIHGGGFTSGSSSVDVYDGASLARQGIVVVSLNYRLGLLGSMASAELRNTGGGNFGLQDQIAALRWVQHNIRAFGGDPKRVTIAGQSAGAFSIHYLIMSPAARGLFRQTIPQSGLGLGAGLDLALDSREHAELSSAAFLRAAGVSTVEEARHLPLAALVAAYRKAGAIPGAPTGFRMVPYADDAVLPLDPISAFRSGHFNDGPVLIGMTADEGSGLNPLYRSTDRDTYEAWVKSRFGNLAPMLLSAFARQEGAAPLPDMTRATGRAAILAWSEERARRSRQPLFGYVWTHTEPGPDSARYGAFHTSEVPYVFGTLSKSPERPFTQEDQALTSIMQRYWANFVKTGNPNGPGLAPWPHMGSDRVMLELGNRNLPYAAARPKEESALIEHIRKGGSLLAL